jgi:photosystem II stability/assembly factor-like uncharacterized protein
LLKSVDSGKTWTAIGVTEFSMQEISRILVNPQDPANIFIAASNGIWESIDSGNAWQQLRPDPATDIALLPDTGNPGKRWLVAGLTFKGIYRASFDGVSWSEFTGVVFLENDPPLPVELWPPVIPVRTVFGVCKNKPEHIYAAFSDSSGGSLKYIARSVNSGESWSHCALPESEGAIYQAQYNLTILPKPDDPETVLLGVVEIFKSIDGGKSWKSVTSATNGPAVHSDIHTIAFDSTNPNRVFIGGDGGFYYSPDLCLSWEARNLDLSTIQLYDFGQHPQYESILIAGAQDNGGFHYNGGPIWNRTWVGPGSKPVGLDRMGGDRSF